MDVLCFQLSLQFDTQQSRLNARDEGHSPREQFIYAYLISFDLRLTTLFHALQAWRKLRGSDEVLDFPAI